VNQFLKYAYATFFIGIVFMPLEIFPGEWIITFSSLLFMVSATLFGLHFYSKSKELSNGSKYLFYFYKGSPVLLPLGTLVIRHILK